MQILSSITYIILLHKKRFYNNIQFIALYFYEGFKLLYSFDSILV